MTLRQGFLLARAVVLAMAVATTALAAGRNDIFSVTVPVDATAANASAARDAARAAGERHAYAILLDRLTRSADRARLPPANDALLNALVTGFEVANERRSGVRYLADYTYHFNADAVRRLLTQAGVPFAETQGRPVVVLAVLETAAGPVLWEDPNPWRDAWASTPIDPGLVPVIIPYDDLDDVAAIDGAAADSGDDAHLQAFAKRYGDADVLVTRATLKTDTVPHSLAVSSTRFTPGAPGNEQSWVASYVAQANESDADLLARAVTGTVDEVEAAWKDANLLDFSHAASLTATVPVSDLRSWVAIRDRLAQIPAVRQVELLSLDRQAARIVLHYVGDAAQLRAALAQRNLDLTGTDPDWVLQRHAAAAPP